MIVWLTPQINLCLTLCCHPGIDVLGGYYGHFRTLPTTLREKA